MNNDTKNKYVILHKSLNQKYQVKHIHMLCHICKINNSSWGVCTQCEQKLIKKICKIQADSLDIYDF